MPPTIRLATPGDAATMLAIYAPIVRETAISFELEPPTEAEFRRRIEEVLRGKPWLVCEVGGTIAGYAYATSLRPRPAYQWSVETSAYVDASHRGKGIGRALYTSLLALLEIQGFYRAYAGIALPNPASVVLHESLGFTPVGVYRSVGFKLGAWHDVGWWQSSLGTRHASPPMPPLTLDEARGSDGWMRGLESGVQRLEM